MNEEKTLKKLYDNMDVEYKDLVSNIINNEEFKRRIYYHHHEERSVYVHSLMVSLYSYKIAKFLKLDYNKTAIGGLLHDFYYDDWQLNPKKGIKNLHGFVHAKQAYENSLIFFPEYMDNKTKDIIVKHMFPLTIKPPIYLEGWIVTMVDKFVSFEIFKNPKHLYKYVGLALIFKGRIKW